MVKAIFTIIGSFIRSWESQYVRKVFDNNMKKWIPYVDDISLYYKFFYSKLIKRRFHVERIFRHFLKIVIKRRFRLSIDNFYLKQQISAKLAVILPAVICEKSSLPSIHNYRVPNILLPKT